MPYVSFENIPADILTPGTYVEISNERAVQGAALMPHKILLIGQKLATGILPALSPVLVPSADLAALYAGRGSMAQRMVKALKRSNETTELWLVLLDDDAEGVAATGGIKFSGTATEAGTWSGYINGRQVRLGVASAATSASLATALAAKINADPDMPVAAVVDGADTAKVNLTAKHKGEAGNHLDIRTNYYRGEQNPAGITEAITAMSGGTANPDITPVFAAVGAEWYTTVAMPFTDAANLTALKAELDRRNGPLVMTDGIAYTAMRGSQGQLVTHGLTQNSQHLSCLGVLGAPESPEEWAAAYAGRATFAASVDPAQPVSDVPLTGLMPPAISDRFTREQRDVLLKNGIATFTVNADGNVVLERAVTMYRLNGQGLSDRSYLDTEVLRTVSYLRWSMRVRFAQRFRRKKLGEDGARGPNVVTPKDFRGELIALFGDWQELGLVEDIEQFKRDLIVQISSTDPNRVNILIPANCINQLRVIAGVVQFIL